MRGGTWDELADYHKRDYLQNAADALAAITEAGMVVVDRRVARSILQIAERRAGWTLSKAEHEEFIIPMRAMLAAAEKGETE